MTNDDENLNNSYYPSLKENFNEACALFEKDLTQDEIIEFLKHGNILQRQISALKLTKINNFYEAEVLCENLTGQDGKIRETVSEKILELFKGYQTFFKTTKIYNIFLNAIIDVNSNVCRNILAVIVQLKNNEDFIKFFIPKLLENTYNKIDIVKDFDFQDGKYKVNKEVFKLYWYLETISLFTEHIDIKDIENIANITKDINEYTIREKTAKILSNTEDNDKIKVIKNLLKNDKNYYVRLANKNPA